MKETGKGSYFQSMKTGQITVWIYNGEMEEIY